MYKVTPFGVVDKQTLEKIKMKAIKKELKKWIEFDHKKRFGFEVISKIRESLS